MIRSILFSLFLSATILITSACSMQKDMDDMTSTTGQLKTATDDLGQTAHDLKKGLPSAIALQVMVPAFNMVVDPNTGDTAKLAQAATYFEAMDYQLWSGKGSVDTLQQRDDQMFNDIQYTLFNLDNFIDHKFEIPDLTGLSADNYRILSAMAAAMSQNNPAQISYAKQNHFKAYSVYDLIVDALQNKKTYRTNKDEMPQHVEVILRYEKECQYLLQVRYNHLLVIATSFLTYIGDKSLFQKMWDIFTEGKFSQKVDLSQFSNERLKWINGALVKAQDTKKVIESLHLKLKVSDGVKKLFIAMKPIKSNTTEDDNQRPKIEDDLVNNMNSLSKQME